MCVHACVRVCVLYAILVCASRDSKFGCTYIAKCAHKVCIIIIIIRMVIMFKLKVYVLKPENVTFVARNSINNYFLVPDVFY